MLVLIQGPNDVGLVVLPLPGPERTGGRAQGVRTADLAKAIGEFLSDRGWAAELQVICSHRGNFQGEREAELTGAGVLLRQVAFFIGEEEHTRNTRAGVSDIAVATILEPRQAVLLIEIEESAAGTKPKAVIGDALLPRLADRIDILGGRGTRPTRLDIGGAAVWVAYHPRRGFDVTRTDVLAQKLNGFRQHQTGGTAGQPPIRLFNRATDVLYTILLEEAKAYLTAWNQARPAPEAGA